MHSTRGQLLCVALLALLGLAWSLDAPLLMWSGSEYFAGKNVQVQNTVKVNQFNSILSKLSSKQVENLPANIASVFGNEESAAEVLVLYLEPMIRSDQLSHNRDSFRNLRREVSSAKSSVSMPFVSHVGENTAVASAVASLASSLPTGAGIYYQGNGRTALFKSVVAANSGLQIVQLDDITSNHAIFSNGVLDVLIVELTGMELKLTDKLSKDDAIIAQVQAVVQSATNGKYISIFTSETVYEPAITSNFAESSSHLDVTAREPVTDSGDNDWDADLPWGAYFQYWFWEGLLAFIIFFGTAYIIIYCIMTLQTPSVFLTDKKKND